MKLNCCCHRSLIFLVVFVLFSPLFCEGGTLRRFFGFDPFDLHDKEIHTEMFISACRNGMWSEAEDELKYGYTADEFKTRFKTEDVQFQLSFFELLISHMWNWQSRWNDWHGVMHQKRCCICESKQKLECLVAVLPPVDRMTAMACYSVGVMEYNMGNYDDAARYLGNALLGGVREAADALRLALRRSSFE